jgi:SAM-dependent methyltransferase
VEDTPAPDFVETAYEVEAAIVARPPNAIENPDLAAELRHAALDSDAHWEGSRASAPVAAEPQDLEASVGWPAPYAAAGSDVGVGPQAEASFQTEARLHAEEELEGEAGLGAEASPGAAVGLDAEVDSVGVPPDPEPAETVESPLDVVILFDLPVSPVEDTNTTGEPPIAFTDASSEPAAEPAPPGDEPSLSPLAQTLANMAESMQGELAIEATVDLDVADGPLVPFVADDQSSATAPIPPSRSLPPPPPLGVDAALVGEKPSAAGSAGRLPEALSERPRRTKRSKPWFEEVFDESYLRTLPFMTAEQTLQEVDFIESSLGVPRGSEVLDIACGYGRHAIELVQRGLAVTGLDLSLPLLIRAADESQRRAVSVNFVHTDMREMSFEHQFSGAYCMLTSFGYFDDESNLKVAEAIARALKPGGRFLIDVINRDYIVSDLPSRVWWQGDGCVVLEEVDFNFNTNRILTHRSVVFDDGQQLEHEISIRVYSLHELGKLLRQAGFRVIEVSGSVPTKGHFFGANSRNLMILAERRSE